MNNRDELFRTLIHSIYIHRIIYNHVSLISRDVYPDEPSIKGRDIIEKGSIFSYIAYRFNQMARIRMDKLVIETMDNSPTVIYDLYMCSLIHNNHNTMEYLIPYSKRNKFIVRYNTSRYGSYQIRITGIKDIKMLSIMIRMVKEGVRKQQDLYTPPEVFACIDWDGDPDFSSDSSCLKEVLEYAMIREWKLPDECVYSIIARPFELFKLVVGYNVINHLIGVLGRYYIQEGDVEATQYILSKYLTYIPTVLDDYFKDQEYPSIATLPFLVNQVKPGGELFSKMLENTKDIQVINYMLDRLDQFHQLYLKNTSQKEFKWVINDIYLPTIPLLKRLVEGENSKYFNCTFTNIFKSICRPKDQDSVLLYEYLIELVEPNDEYIYDSVKSGIDNYNVSFIKYLVQTYPTKLRQPYFILDWDNTNLDSYMEILKVIIPIWNVEYPHGRIMDTAIQRKSPLAVYQLIDQLCPNPENNYEAYYSVIYLPDECIQYFSEHHTVVIYDELDK